ncbi:4-hydroxy-tetrahydrodipicolinate reductase [Flaviaesturariibacter flavus]|uniref:4-hydroxy-tetrahydrodipicolinate reductase n=1 Tax=Flaviaesturariibacter flavus TaxID=2502780 RepID=A0A4R1B2F1_9BACT|nr:4-hydroxy-tetrahydrodipicolinate reductase [Flaviaesturariibacter flavus]TCJ12001.1 4-hydroxy-tetrahydrodipicolinate reductase [Flaviaesturariibacter flavus]
MKIALIGYGKMGQLIDRIAQERGHEVLYRIHSDNREEFNEANLRRADVAIEFTGPESAFDNVRHCLEWGVPVVSGSTGWNERLEEARRICTERGGTFLHASNFSIGVNLFFEVNKHLARLMAAQPQYDVELKEIHHTAKKDAPSGTAVTLAEQVLEALGRKQQWVKETAAGAQDLVIRSERTDPAPGTHHVRYFSPIDDIEIIHTAHSREGFAAGALTAAEFVHNRKGVFTMKDVLGF